MTPTSLQVAAGMSIKFDVCLTARDVTDIGHVAHDVTVVTETEIFKLPFRATILPIQVPITTKFPTSRLHYNLGEGA